jgi:hypothetical protein
MLPPRLMAIVWPGFLAACVLQATVFTVIDPLEIPWTGQGLPWSRQAVYAAGFLLFWGAGILASALTALLGPTRSAAGIP